MLTYWLTRNPASVLKNVSLNLTEHLKKASAFLLISKKKNSATALSQDAPQDSPQITRGESASFVPSDGLEPGPFPTSKNPQLVSDQQPKLEQPNAKIPQPLHTEKPASIPQLQLAAQFDTSPEVNPPSTTQRLAPSPRKLPTLQESEHSNSQFLASLRPPELSSPAVSVGQLQPLANRVATVEPSPIKPVSELNSGAIPGAKSQAEPVTQTPLLTSRAQQNHLPKSVAVVKATGSCSSVACTLL